MYTLLYLNWKTNKDLYHIAHGTLLNVIWQPGRVGGLGRMDICICTIESRSGTLETITTLVISYTPI